MVVRLRAIGECGIDVGDAHVGPDAELAFALLLVLSLAGGHTVARRRLTDLLWPCTPDDRARHNLRQTLYKLRQLGVPVESESLHVWLPADAVAPHPLLDAETEDDGVAASELLRADRPFGEFLAGYAPTFSAPFAAWLDEQRSVVHARLRRAALTRLHDERRRGAWAAVEMLARKVLQLDSLNEEATLALAEATVMAGSKRAAIAQLDAYLRDLGPSAGDIRLPAALLRRRIAERMPPSLSPPDGDPCFVGRTESMAFLHDQFRHVRGIGARTVLVWGDAGIGKSRLTTEFARLAVMEGAQIARVGCQARDVDRPLSIFVDIVPHLLGLPGAIGCSPDSMTYLRRLTSHDPTVLEPASEPREAELLFAYVRRAILDLVDAVASESALLLVFEDVHWLDEQSWRVLRELIGWLERRRVLVVLTSRVPHATPTRPVRGAAGVVEHRLAPLARAEALALFDAATSGDVVPAEYREWCVEVADGNPLFVCECARATDRGRRATPATLAADVERRIRSLDAHASRLLLAVAVLGDNADDQALLQVLGIRRDELITRLRDVAEHRLVVTDAATLRCRHSVIEDVALACAQPGELAILHRGSAEYLERVLDTTHDAKLLWQCAHHWLEGHSGRNATRLIERNAAHLLAIGAAAAACDLFERGLALTTTSDDRCPMLDGLAAASSLSGSWRRCHSAADEADVLRRTIGLSAAHDQLKLEARWRLSHPARELLKDADEILHDDRKSAVDRVAAGVFSLIFSDHLCDQPAARRAYDACKRIAALHMERGVANALRTAEMIFHASFGDLATSAQLAEAAERIEMHDDPMRVFRECCRASIPLRRVGRYTDADRAVRRAFAIAEDYHMLAPQCLAADILASSAFDQGRIDDAAMWWQLAHARVSSVDIGEVSTSVDYLGVRIALHHHDVELAGSCLHAPPSMVLNDSSIRRRVEGLASYLAVAVARSDTYTVVELLPHLVRDHFTARAFGGQDFAASVMISALRYRGMETDAETAIRSYTETYRRETSELPSYFPRPI